MLTERFEYPLASSTSDATGHGQHRGPIRTYLVVCTCCGFQYVPHILPCRINVLPVDIRSCRVLATLRLVLMSGTCTVALIANRTAANCVLNNKKISEELNFVSFKLLAE